MDKKNLKKQITEILSPLPYIGFAYLFGSQTSGTAGVLSDVDIAVFFNETVDDRGKTYGFECELALDLERILGYPIDLVALNKASNFLRYQVLKKGELLFCHSENVRIKFHEDTIRTYLDFLPFRDVQNKYLKQRINKGLFGR